MPSELPRLFLARHGDTAWTDSRQRTGRTDIPLNAVGEDRARQFGVSAEAILFRVGLHQPASTRFQDVRTRRVWRGREGRSRPGRVGLRALRGAGSSGNPEGTALLGAVS